MSWNLRLCTTCGGRFAPVRLEDRLCRGCASAAGDLPVVIEYLERHVDANLTRVAVATGVSEEAIREFARDGRLPRIPEGAEPERRCLCPPGRTAACPACRAELAAKIAGAHRTGPTAPAAPLVRGMGTRRG
jgi:hypothetical protein